MTQEEANDISTRAEDLADALAPEVITLISDVVDEWYENRTTLSGESGQNYKAALKRRTKQTLAAKLMASSARFE